VGDAHFSIDDVAVAGTIAGTNACTIDVAPGEHRVVAERAGHAPAIVLVDVAAGETLWLSPTLTPLHASAPPLVPPAPPPLWWTATATGIGVIGVVALVGSGALGTTALAAIEDAEAATVQIDRVRARDAVNASIAGAGLAATLGVITIAAAVTMAFGGAPP
jgi:hypothetical protein